MISLRPFTPDDDKVMLDILTDNQIKQTFLLPDFPQKQDALPLFLRLMALSLNEAHYVRGIYHHDLLIGFINDVEIQGSEIELGYVIHPNHQRHGYMTAALTNAIQELFQKGYRQIKAGAFSENTASIRVMEKCGMHPISQSEQITYRGKEHLCVYFAIEEQE